MTRLGEVVRVSAWADAQFSEPKPDEKVLQCETCGMLRSHQYYKTAYVRFFFKPLLEAKYLVNGSGQKDLWLCNACGTVRIYGAPAEEKKK
jgi:hypothetical protein